MSTAYLQIPSRDDPHRVAIKLVRSEKGVATFSLYTNASEGELSNPEKPVYVHLKDGDWATVLIED
jgi:hypothetical protein